ncbi:MAG: diguanylate cyclase [Deltaproteobacteria bacterium]|nr:diguanylate cyclase [Deltaproteobacteria bacterium]
MATIPSESKILETISDAVVSCDGDGRILWCNRATYTLLGYATGELHGAHVSMLVSVDQEERLAELLGNADEAAAPADAATAPPAEPPRPPRLEARRADGSTLTVSIAASRYSIGGTPMLTLVLRDATLAAEREKDLERVRDELGMQMRVNRVLENAESSEALIDEVLQEVVSLDQLDVHKMAGLFLLEESGPPGGPADRVHLPLAENGPARLHLVAHIGDFSDDFLERESTIPIGSCLCGRAAASGEVLVSDDCSTDPRHEHEFHEMTAHGHYIIPLKAGGEVTGVVFLYTDPDPVWDDRRRVLLETLGVQIGMGLARAHDHEALLQSRADFAHLATYDALTGVLNRRAIFERLAQERARQERDTHSVSVILFDIDHFKRVNDQYGHAVGDAVLKQVAHRIKAALRPYDEIGRYGGEEFLIVLPGCPEETAGRVAERLRVSLAQTPIDCSVGPLTISASFGIAHCSAERTDEALVSAADDALYRAKRGGRNRIELD